MHILLDYRWLQATNDGILTRGTGRYVLQQTEAVLTLDTTNRYTIVVEQVRDFALIPRTILDKPNVELFQVNLPTLQDWQPNRLLEYQEYFMRQLVPLKPDLYHRTAPMARLAFNFPQFDLCPYVVNLFDLIPLVYPSHYPIDATFERSLVACQRADKIITLSQHSQCDIVKLLGYTNPIIIAPPYADAQFTIRDVAWCETILKSLALPSDFVLTVSGLHHSKNLETLLLGMQGLKLPLVIACQMNPLEVEEIERLAALIDIDVIVLGLVSDEMLIALYNTARVYVHPSRYEGFGLPPLEAMACGAPVVMAKVSSMPEINQYAASVVNPDNSDQWRQQIQYWLDLPRLPQDARQSWHDATRVFNQQLLGERTLQAYEA